MKKLVTVGTKSLNLETKGKPTKQTTASAG